MQGAFQSDILNKLLGKKDLDELNVEQRFCILNLNYAKLLLKLNCEGNFDKESLTFIEVKNEELIRMTGGSPEEFNIV